MSIRSKLRLLALGTALLIALASACLYWAERGIGLALCRSQGAYAILSGVTELNLLANEFDGSNASRLETQWTRRWESLNREIATFVSVYPKTPGLDRFMREFIKAEGLFDEFVSVSKQVQQSESRELVAARANLLAHFTVVLVSVEANAKKVSSEAVREIGDVQRTRNLVLLGIVVVAVVMFCIWLRFLSRGILAPLEVVHRGVVRLRDGELGCEVPVPASADEVGALARAFNEMSRSLRDVTVSRDELQREVQVRKKAEASLRDAQRAVFAAGERERIRIGRELHDGICQDLTAIRLHLGNLVHALSPSEIEVGRSITAVNDYLLKVLEEIRRLVMDLRPAMLDEIGLLSTLRWKCRQIRKAHGLDISLDMPGDEARIPEDLKGTLYRIVQEALNNIVRHSGARHADVVLEIDEDELTLIVFDDGCGFDVEQGARAGYGLANMRERAHAFGGSFEVSSAQGVRLTARFPLQFVDADG
ncbi:signal transduction histidine kinase [Desulfobaculum xiamenense]|uniref:histidine kinase n=1 Tax=Desulfobaculum xiamenense TaxID=995050 RepID=A0A846QJE1_9BACT|nr:sensor histidine kinase [Desulfobaculum xiamenense]NJB67197.1 signal transduction histidine kinase [Desulfobaculum xiamenense]